MKQITKKNGGMRVSQYSKEELNFVIQALVPLAIIGGLATFLITNSGGFPWFTLLGTAIGLSIIILSWVGRKYSIFAASLHNRSGNFYSTLQLEYYFLMSRIYLGK